MTLRDRWHAASALLTEYRDVLEGRPLGIDVPAVLIERDWAGYLAELDDATLDMLEAKGSDATWPADAPESLVKLTTAARDVAVVSALQELTPSRRTPKRFETPRKQLQVDAFAQVVAPLAAKASRVLDVGSGHGHLTRELADRLGEPVVGLERDATLAARARSLSKPEAASFTTTDVLADGLELARGDCIVGLHACGELGDSMVASARTAGASIALVGCCLQKRRAETRVALCEGGVELPKPVLGLSNLTARDDGVEATRTENLRARERRLALHRLFTEAGLELRVGATLEGLNRRTAHGDLEALVKRAFALRELPLPSHGAIERAASWAAVQHARMRRLSIPRSLLGRVLEVFVLFDRALYLENHGFKATVGILFPPSISARNLTLLASVV